MSVMEWVVVIGGVATITWINWYFFLAQGRVADVAKEDRSWTKR
jgi:hypothetical protein